MHNRLIFRYHRVRAQAEADAARGCHLRVTSRTGSVEASDEGTQEGR